MCGIAGIMRLPGGRDACESLVGRMCDAMAHRGPDDAGLWTSADHGVVLGHRRLSIVDLSSAGHCPMPNADGSLWITYNGEVYNHAAYRPSLEAKGYRYRSRTDTETLLYLYEQHGVGMLDHLRGMFAFALWDAPLGRLFLARDRLGIKPLYYTVAGGQLIFASEIKAILEHSSVSRELDEPAFAQYLTFAAVPPPDTLFAGIRKLPAGHYLLADAESGVRVQRWWTPLSRSADSVLPVEGEAESVAAIRQLLVDAVVEQTMADVPHGVLLSGGLDSTLILSILSSRLDRPVRTFSIGFENDPAFDERSYARSMAAHFRSEHVELVLSPNEVIAALPELVHAQDEPLADWVCLPLKALTRTVRDAGVIVVQVGEGSDELFAGYPRYLRYARVHERLWRPYLTLPGTIRRAAGRLADGVLSRADRLREVRDLFLRAGAGLPLFVSGAVAAWDSEKRQLLSAETLERLDGRASSGALARKNFEEYARLAPQGDFVAGMAFEDLAVRLPELLLMRVDKMAMLNSVEARVPFLDHRLVELAFAIPGKSKLAGNVTKRMLKLAAEGLVPSEVIHRRKFGFDVPLARWLREAPLAAWSRHTILDSALLRRGILNRERVTRMLAAHQTGHLDAGFRLWNLLNASAWYDRWIEPVSR